jgi:hypothetical protein
MMVAVVATGALTPATTQAYAWCPYENGSQLLTGQLRHAPRTRPGDPPDGLCAANGKTFLTLFPEGGMELRREGGYSLWGTAGGGSGIDAYQSKLVMQADGNLVVLMQGGSDPNYKQIWSSGTSGFPGAKLVLLDDGNLMVVDAQGYQRWATNTAWYTPDHLTGGQKLSTNQQLRSANGNNRLTLQADGNLVVNRVDTGQVLWGSATQGKPMSQVVMQDDGNFVGRDNSGSTVYFSTKTYGFPGAQVVLRDDGNLVIVDAQGVQRWSALYTPVPSPAPARMMPGQKLATGQQLVSGNGKARLTLQSDGNLVLYRVDNGVALWASNTQSWTVTQVLMQYDGNVVAYGPNLAAGAQWRTATAGNRGASLVLRDDGNLVVLAENGAQLWATNTHVP